MECRWVIVCVCAIVITTTTTTTTAYRILADSEVNYIQPDLLDQYVAHVDEGRREHVYDGEAVFGVEPKRRELGGQTIGSNGNYINKETKTRTLKSVVEEVVNGVEEISSRVKRSVESDNVEVVSGAVKRSVDSDIQEVVNLDIANNVGDVYEEDVDEVLEEDAPKSWTHSVVLDGPGNVRLSWTPRADHIEFFVEAATAGYVGVGFSPGRDMAGADIVFGWVDDDSGKPHMVDCYGASKTATPLVDTEQNYELLGGSQNDTHTLLTFRRSLDTCDSQHDMILGSDTVRVIWATHRSDPFLDETGQLKGLNWHGKEHRGVRSLHLVNPPAKGHPLGDNIHHWDVTLEDFEVPDNMDTLYWCKIFKLPPLTRKHHMIGYEPILTSGDEGYVHHMLLYECVGTPRNDAMFARYESHKGASCYSPNMPQDWDRCLTPIAAWAIGSEGEFLPGHVGLPLAEGNRATYFMLEIHYDNPAFRRVKDNSGLRVYYTEELRKYDGGILVNGITVTPLHIIPPRQPEYRTAGYCSSQCTQKMFPQTGINLLSVVLHSHLAGKKLRLRHVRGGEELPRIAYDDHYDFNYQQTRVLPREVTVLPGDELVTECVYQTPNRTEPTFGGYSTKQEMCLAFILYYPRTPLAACYSMTPVKYFFETFGVREFYNTDMDTVEKMFLKLGQPDGDDLRPVVTTSTTPAPDFGNFPPGSSMDKELNERAILALKQMKEFTVEEESSGGLFGELVIKEPLEFRNKSFMSHLFELPWEEMLLTQRVEESFYSGQHMVFCRKQDDTLAIPADINMFPNFTALSTENNTQCQQSMNHLLHQTNSATSTMPAFLIICAIITHRFFT